MVVCRGLVKLLIVLVVAVLGVSCFEDTEFPSLRSSLGGKMAIADDYYDDDDEVEAEPQVAPKPCCFPLVWEGGADHELVISGSSHHGKSSGPRLTRSIDQFYVDGQNQRVAGHVTQLLHHAGKWIVARNFSWIFRVGANRTGQVYLFDGKKCQQRVVRDVVWRRQCLPANASFHGGFTLGPAQGGLAVQTWLFGGRTRSAPRIEGDTRPYPRPRVCYSVGIDVVPGSCIPVLMKERGFVFRGIDEQSLKHDDFSGHVNNIHDTGLLDDDDDHSKYENYVRRRVMEHDRGTTERPHPRPRPHGFGFMDHSQFTDVKTRIDDPKVFAVPAYCKKADDDDDAGDHEMPTILERFFLL